MLAETTYVGDFIPRTGTFLSMPNRQRIVDEIAALATSVQKPIQTGNTEVLANLPE